MSNFALKRIKAVKGQIKFAELFIDDIGQLTSFQEALGNKDQADLDSIFYYMERVSNSEILPHKQFKKVKINKNTEVYCFKKGVLRVYAIKGDDGKIIVLGGFKNTQDEDYNLLGKLIPQFKEQRIKIKEDENKNRVIEK